MQLKQPFIFNRFSQLADQALEVARRLRQEQGASEATRGTYRCPVGEDTGHQCRAVVLKRNLRRHLKLHFPPDSAEVRLTDDRVL